VSLDNKIPLNTWNLHAKSFYDDIFDGNTSIRSLRVTRMITAYLINDIIRLMINYMINYIITDIHKDI